MNVLIVEDNHTYRDLLKDYFSQFENYNIIAVEDVTTALYVLYSFRVNFVLTDINMPKINGIEFLFRLKELGIPVIIISGYDKQIITDNILKDIGVINVFQKPVEMNKIKEAIETHLTNLK